MSASCVSLKFAVTHTSNGTSDIKLLPGRHVAAKGNGLLRNVSGKGCDDVRIAHVELCLLNLACRVLRRVRRP